MNHCERARARAEAQVAPPRPLGSAPAAVLTLIVKGDAETACAHARARGFSTANRRYLGVTHATCIEVVGDEMAAHRWYAEQPAAGPDGFPVGTLLYFTL